MNFSFGSNTPKTTATTAPGSLATPAPTATGFSLGTPATNTLFGSTPAGGGFSLGGAGDSKPTVQTSAVKPMAAAAPLSSFSLGTSALTTSTSTFPSFGLTSTASTTSTAAATSTPGFGFGSSIPSVAATSAPAPISFSLTPGSATTATPTLKLGTTAATTATTLATTTSSATTATALGLPANITFVQLQETIKKWTDEFNEQEKIFMSQAGQINKWDNLLRSNSDKILELNSEVATMKLQQQKLSNELEFIQTQQRELEEVLGPLERQAADVPTNTDPEREHTYHMAETLDTQLKQMSEDLREIIENLNESSRTQDNSDPIVQIARILNAHMNSLHWIDQMSLNIQNQLENVTKLHDTHRRENERLFRISYD
uniref:Nucleoporin NSP1-like C-terminal domain-containing protein n=1 Tax=Graphocephala atropunctata TaxID=36148 RepID=A0A1B6KP56_9HEMI